MDNARLLLLLRWLYLEPIALIPRAYRLSKYASQSHQALTTHPPTHPTLGLLLPLVSDHACTGSQCMAQVVFVIHIFRKHCFGTLYCSRQRPDHVVHGGFCCQQQSLLQGHTYLLHVRLTVNRTPITALRTCNPCLQSRPPWLLLLTQHCPAPAAAPSTAVPAAVGCAKSPSLFSYDSTLVRPNQQAYKTQQRNCCSADHRPKLWRHCAPRSHRPTT